MPNHYRTTIQKHVTAIKFTCILPLIIFFSYTEKTGAAECENGWVAYKDTLCFKAFPTLLTFNEAEDFCSRQGNELSKSSLVMVKESDIQELLVNYTNEISGNMWLGGRYDQDAAQFKWKDGTPMTYTNWMEGSPRKDSDSNVCIEMSSINATFTGKGAQGKWAYGHCNKRNLAICQRALEWTLQDAMNEIINIRKQLVLATQESNSLLERLDTTEQNLEMVSSRVIPVGSTYIEYHGQPDPPSLWPDLTWQDVTSTYAGLFFRAAGGNAASWGTSQTDCTPRITHTTFGIWQDSKSVKNYLDLPTNGVSEFVQVGSFDDPSPMSSNRFYEGLKFTTAGCEVRPVNQAMRIWKRTA